MQVVNGLWVSRSLVMTKALITDNSKWEKTTQQLQLCVRSKFILSSRESFKLGWAGITWFLSMLGLDGLCVGWLWTDLSWFNLMEAIKVM